MLKTWRTAIAVLGVAAIALPGCGSSDDDSPDSTASTAASGAPAAKSIKVGLVTDVGGLNDRSFNFLANKGLQEAKSQLGVDVRVITSKSNADYIPNLTTLARQKYDLVIPVGFLMADATAAVAKKFPDTKFAIIDMPSAALKGKPTNVTGILFKENEAGYLAGYAAGLYAKDNDAKAVSSVGGQKSAPVDGYIAGYQAGAKAADPGIKTLNGYSQDFVDQAKCKEVALDQIAQGSKVVFQVAGQCGLGALDAAKEKGVQGVGVDADQGYLGTYVLTSAVKKIDAAVVAAVKAAQGGTLQGGTDVVGTVKNGEVGIGALGPEATGYADQLKAIQDTIASGELKDIPSEVK
ncbi:BMP family ABC transporter substrate-binding protein [Patulibacter sp. NPDC049589]|uniref:BMP family lipoprotein n=1 Tax=Patulibacter sp. NPDC049589 TaxID=3154731 RepID=UPI0034475ED8